MPRFRSLVWPLLFALPAPAFATVGPVDARVRLNSIGFTPAAVKQATIAAPATAFRVQRTSDDAVVLSGAVGPEVRTAPGDTDEAVRIADFGLLVAPGEYQLDVVGVGRSAPFTVNAAVWNQPLRLAARAFNLWRCGAEVSAAWGGRTYHHEACHLDDAWTDYITGTHQQQDARGGWHDAGDYNKYTVNAGVTVGLLFKAWEHFRPQLARVELDLPESGNGTPDLLNELRWELDWLLKLQLPDGRVCSKVSERYFSYWGPPELDVTPRYFVPWSTTATADFAAMMAMASRHFAAYDRAFADRCLGAARSAWAVLAANPVNVPAGQGGFTTGTYVADDASHRVWAAAELWATTGEAEFLAEFERRAATLEFSALGPTWGDVTDLALATYLDTPSAARNATLSARLRSSVIARADAIVGVVNTHPYGRGLGGETWFWGVNGSVAAQTFLLHEANRQAPAARYRQAAEVTIGHLFGRNYHNRSYVTGLGWQPPEHPHDRRGEPAWPGYLVGGGWPDGRSWEDVQADYQQNEIAINWNASLVYALAALADDSGGKPEYDWAVFTVGSPGVYQPSFSPLTAGTFSAEGLPHWATLDTATGAISGTPRDDPATPGNNARRHYPVIVRGRNGSQVFARRQVNVMVAEPGSRPKIVNLAARGYAAEGEKTLIAGFVASGATRRPFLLRGVGPTLVELGVSGYLTDPALTLFSGSAAMATNSDWETSSDRAGIRAAFAALGAYPLPAGSRDAALLPSLVPQRYTIHVTPPAGGGGVALAEIFDGEPGGADGQLLNISARAFVAAGDEVLIGGTVLEGGGSARILIRAVGPTLTTQAITQPLDDPVLTVYSGQTALATNDEWSASADAAEIAAAARQVGAFELPVGSHDAALIAPLVSGSFTAVVTAKPGASGIVLVELYLLP